jgi:hypothetical protein
MPIIEIDTIANASHISYAKQQNRTKQNKTKQSDKENLHRIAID